MKDKKYKLERDTCPECIKMIGQKNSLGEQMYCSAGHAYELSQIKRGEDREKRIKELFEMVYGWGKANIKVNDTSPAFREIVNELIDTYY